MAQNVLDQCPSLGKVLYVLYIWYLHQRHSKSSEQSLTKRDGRIIFLNINVREAELLFDLRYVNIHIYKFDF